MAVDAFTELDPGPEFEVIARSIVKSKRRKKKKAPKAHDLANALTGVTISDTIHGSSTLEITIFDEEFRLLDSGFFDADENGLVDPIELNYPDGSASWWRATQVRYTQDAIATLSFMERPAVYMAGHHGPLKGSRGKYTRAQFIRLLTSKVQKGGGIRFVSHDLTVKQPLEKKPKTRHQRTQDKDKGISLDEARDLKIGGVHCNMTQVGLVEAALDVADRLNAGEKATMAMLVAGIGESNFRNVVNSLGYGGVFQGQVAVPGGTNWFAPMGAIKRTQEEAESFLLGGRGYNQGGAIHLAKGPDDIGEIATKVETSGQPGSFYGVWAPEAKALLAAYGGVTGGTHTRNKQFNFKVGMPNKPHENFWDAAQRLASEVNWALFIDGRTVYYDPETTLIKQKPAMIIRRSEAAIITWDVTADNRDIASEMNLELVCKPFAVRAGQTVSVRGFGPASSVSTVKLPGRWLIEEIERDITNVYSTITLKQPEDPKKEPRPETRTTTDSLVDDGLPIQGTPREIIDSIVVPMAQELGFNITPESVASANAAHTHLGSASDHAGNGSDRWAADISDSTHPSARMDKMAKRLLARFNAPVKHLGSPHATSGAPSGNLISWEDGGYRFQVIYRYNDPQAGNHFNHVHFGIKWLKFHGPLKPVRTEDLVPPGSPPVLSKDFPRP